MVPAPRTAPLKRVGAMGDALGMRRALATAVLGLALLAPAAHAERTADPAVLRAQLTALAAARGTVPVPAPTRTPTTGALRRLLVAQLGLAPAAAAVQTEAVRAGLTPPPRFGDEVVAGLLGLRRNVKDERRERQPWEPVTAAEAAHAVRAAARADADGVRWLLATFRLPAYTPEQRFVLRMAVLRIGMPYVWGGELDTAGVLGGPQPVGGYDCSGLVWRVFKLSGLPQGRAIRGRTAAQQAGEVPKATRIGRSGVVAGDLLFFGKGTITQRATEARITHEAIAMSPQWMVHASSAQGGVAVVPIDSRPLSWARRVL